MLGRGSLDARSSGDRDRAVYTTEAVGSSLNEEGAMSHEESFRSRCARADTGQCAPEPEGAATQIVACAA